MEANNKLVGSFEVISGGLLDVDVSVRGPSNEVHYSVERQKAGTFNMIAPSAGVYRLCFANRAATMAEKAIAFSMHKGDALFREMAKAEQVSPLEKEVTELADSITKVEDEQTYMWSREKASRAMNESTNSRVIWFSVAETGALLAAGAWQIYSLRAMFDKRGEKGKR